MNKWQKTGLIILIMGTLVFIKIAFFTAHEPVVSEPQAQEEQPDKAKEETQDGPKSYVNVYFIGQNDNKEEVYKPVKRKYDAKTDGTKLNFAIKNLLEGPSAKEKTKGVYSEVPSGTKLLSLEEKSDKIIINVNNDFETGGGTDGLYKRLYQLIKTANRNTSIPVYLYINGKQAEVIGGEGIMINQPLNEKSLDE